LTCGAVVAVVAVRAAAPTLHDAVVGQSITAEGIRWPKTVLSKCHFRKEYLVNAITRRNDVVRILQ
jgi:hypothetical protein